MDHNAADNDSVVYKTQYKYFSWKEDNENVELTIPIPDEIEKPTSKSIKVVIKSKALKVDISNTSDRVIIRDAEQRVHPKSPKMAADSVTAQLSEFAKGTVVPLLDLPVLYGQVIIDESTWFVSGREIHVSLCKAAAGKWDSLEKDF
jgi:hypothetical protein